MLRRLISPVAVLLPLLPFSLAADTAGEWMSDGRILAGISLLLGSLAVLALLEGLLFRFLLLPAWGQALGERLYGGSYIPADDELARLADRIRSTEDASLLPDMQRIVLRQRKRVRGWLELARLYQDIAHDDKSALQTLLSAVDAVSDREERAMLLYRAGALAANKLHSPAQAAEYFRRAASDFPNTVYGRHAAARAATR